MRAADSPAPSKILGVHPSTLVRTVRSHARAGHYLCSRGLLLRAVVHQQGEACGRPSHGRDGGPSRRRAPPTGAASVRVRESFRQPTPCKSMATPDARESLYESVLREWVRGTTYLLRQFPPVRGMAEHLTPDFGLKYRGANRGRGQPGRYGASGKLREQRASITAYWSSSRVGRACPAARPPGQ
jgi:hypothetical protein